MKTFDAPRLEIPDRGAPEGGVPETSDAAPRRRCGSALPRRAILGVVGLALVLTVAVLLAGGQRNDPEAAPTISYGESTCARCGMIIDDPRYAAAYRTSGGEALFFDGVDEMVLYHRARREEVAAFFVHDYNTREWLRAESAYFVVGARLRPAMGSGVAALPTEAGAQELADRQGGTVLNFGALLETADLPSGGHAGQ